MLVELWVVSSAYAAAFTVNSREDVPDMDPGNGLCVAYILFVPPFYVFPFCTLRAAIQETNALAGSDTIQLPSGEYVLQQNGIGEDLGATGDLDITDPVSIVGAGVGETVINGNGIDRVFDIHADASSVLFSNLTLRRGQTTGEDGDGPGGAGVLNRGNLTLHAVNITENSARSLRLDQGGGLYNQGNCTVDQSTISGNSALLGGGVYNGTGASLIMEASTISQNSSNEGGGVYNQETADLKNATISGNQALGSGGGIWNHGTMHLLQVTVTGNSSGSVGAGVANGEATTLMNTIISNNIGDDCNGDELLSSGGNLVGDARCLNGSRLVSDLVGVDPQLGILADNGGPTWTHALYYTSPAVNKGVDSAQGIVTDQRGMRRPLGGRYDIGAYEAVAPVAPFVAPLLLSQ